MDIFFELLTKLIPIFLLILLGYIAGKYFKVNKNTVANLLIYIISPVVVFYGVVTTEINAGTLALPIIFFAVSCLVALITYGVANFVWKDGNRNAVAFIGGSSNSGFFGLPVAVALFGEGSISVVALAILGTTLYLTTFGYFLAAKGKHTSRESLIKVLTMPILYGFIIGVFIHYINFSVPSNFLDIARSFNGAFIVLGMMMVGLGLADIKRYEFDKVFVFLSFFAKFVIWPAVILGIILVDRKFFGFYDEYTQKILVMLSLVPVAGNIVAYSTILKSHPEKSALSVFLTTIFGLIFIPIVAVLFF
ncbi:AEC family transporter [Candidatus Parcubacteria bacterium]|nr:AEC family transporter [Candidatus Parcubacteria bacterium]